MTEAGWCWLAESFWLCGCLVPLLCWMLSAGFDCVIQKFLQFVPQISSLNKVPGWLNALMSPYVIFNMLLC